LQAIITQQQGDYITNNIALEGASHVFSRHVLELGAFKCSFDCLGSVLCLVEIKQVEVLNGEQIFLEN
jgi:hypothetical protein